MEKERRNLQKNKRLPMAEQTTITDVATKRSRLPKELKLTFPLHRGGNPDYEFRYT